MATCLCSDGVFGAGKLNCNELAGRADRRVYVPLRADDGTLNKISAADIASGIDSTYIQAKIDLTDFSKKWVVMPKGRAFVSERADDNTEDIDGIPYPTSQGNRTETYSVIKAPFSLKKVIDSAKCKEMGYYDFTVDGEILGHKKDVTGDLYPVPIEDGTLTSKSFKPGKNSFQRLDVMHIVSDAFNDAEYGYIPSGDITADLRTVNGSLQLLIANASADSATNYTLDASYFINDSVDAKPFTDLDSATTNVVVYNNTTSSSVTVGTITETVGTPGNYTIVLPAQTTSDSLTFSNGLSGVKWDSFDLVAL